MGKKGSLKGKLNKIDKYDKYVRNNLIQYQTASIQTDISKQGDLVTIQTINGNEIGMVMSYIKKNQLRDCLKSLNVSYDESNKIWKYNYSVLGHYKSDDINEYILSDGDMNKYPKINILIVKVNSKTDYDLVIGRTPEILLLIDTIKHISLEDEKIPDLMVRLLNTSVMSLATKDMKKTYQAGQNKKLKELEVDSIEKDSSDKTV